MEMKEEIALSCWRSIILIGQLVDINQWEIFLEFLNETRPPLIPPSEEGLTKRFVEKILELKPIIDEMVKAGMSLQEKMSHAPKN